MIPVNEPLLGERELEYVSECLRTGWISSSGRFLEAFEQAWAAYCGMQHGIAVSNGTAALHLAVACLGLQPGDEVILPTFTIISCAQAVTYCGGVPVLVDSDPDTWCMDARQIESRITERTRAIMPVHIYGHPVDMDPIRDLADRRGLILIEDAAEAHGAEYQQRRGTGEATWRRCGGLGHLSAFSFYANKPVTTGEGGMVLTNDARLAEKARSLRNLGFRPERRFLHAELGFNFRLTNLQAAIGLAQIERLEEILARKRWMGQAYTERLRDLPEVHLQVVQPWARPIYWMFGLVVDEATGLEASRLAARLREQGVETRPFFLGMHEQPALQRLGLFHGERYPVAERIARQGLYLPSGLALTEAQLDHVCRAMTHALRGAT
jgi:perosamine synthetase